MSFRQIQVKDLLLVDHEGTVVEGTWPLNLAAFVIHSQIHAARPDVVSAAHAHSVHGKAWSTLHRPLDPLTQDACAFYGDHALFDDYTGAVLDLEEGKRIAHALGDHKAAILANHGLLDRRPHGRRGGVVVRHHGAHVPGPAAGRGGGHAGARSGPRWPRRPPARPAATAPAGRSSSRSTTRSSPRSPTCSRSSGRARPVLNRLGVRGGP